MQASDVASHTREEQCASGERRRSQRISLMVPLVVSGLSSRCKFAEYCKTLQINGYGCQIRLSRPLKAGTQVRLDVMDDNANRVTTAYVVHSELVLTEAEKDVNFWNTGLALDKPGNVWGVPSPPEDWSMIDWPADKPAADATAPPAETAMRSSDQPATRPSQTPASPPAPSEAPSSRQSPSREAREDEARRGQQRGRERREYERSLRRRLLTEGVADDANAGRSDQDREQYPALFRPHAESAGPNRNEPRRPPAPQGERPGVDRLQQEWRQAVDETTARLAGLEARLEKAAAELEAGTTARLQQAAGEMVRQAREQIDRDVAVCCERRLAGLDTELERKLGPLADRSQATISDLERLLEALKREQGLWETKVAQFQQQGQQLQSRLTQETRRFHELVHDALVETGGQIKGRINAAIEAAQEPVERRVLDAHTQIEELAGRKADELAQRIDLSLQRLDAVQAEASHAIHASLDAQRADVLERFQQQTRELTVTSLAQTQAALNDALRSLSRVLQERLDPASAKRFVEWGTGERRSTAA